MCEWFLMTVTTLESGLFCVVWVVPKTDNRTERLCILLTASSNHHCLTCMYLIQPSLMSPCFPKNRRHPRIVAVVSDRRNMVTVAAVTCFIVYKTTYYKFLQIDFSQIPLNHDKCKNYTPWRMPAIWWLVCLSHPISFWWLLCWVSKSWKPVHHLAALWNNS